MVKNSFFYLLFTCKWKNK